MRPRFVEPGEQAIDMGAGSGALAMRVKKFGWNVKAADTNARRIQGLLPFVSWGNLRWSPLTRSLMSLSKRPAALKFLLAEEIRMMDEASEPTHTALCIGVLTEP
jgi:hypothetical protein